MSDILRWPLFGRALRWRHARTSAQVILLLVAAVIVLHGLLGPQLAPRNLATVATWVHYRGLLVIALLAAGNFFCMGCPFVRVRDWGRRLHAPVRRWPRLLRTKWIGIALFAGVLFCYELFDLWALPRATAWLVLGYFGAALLVDTVFSGATFCKHLCPIGQFNFVASTISPLELRVREPETRRTCGTFDCIKGRMGRKGQQAKAVVQRGCELGLFLPSKVGNLDCTFCLDCVQACPHDNIALATRLPGLELLETRRRSGIGRLAQRPDLAALAVLFTFGGLLNAFAMATPAHHVLSWLSGVTGGASEGVALAVLFAAGLVAAPLVLLGAAAGLTRLVARDQAGSIVGTAVRYAYVLVPFGFGVWLAHYGFHFLTGALTIVPVTQSAAQDLLGWAALGDPLWRWTGLRPGAVLPIEIGFILLGAAGSLALAYGVSEREYAARPGAATAPWAAVVVTLAALAVWTLAQPMEMRGMPMGPMAHLD
jgi:polyferredoxin